MRSSWQLAPCRLRNFLCCLESVLLRIWLNSISHLLSPTTTSVRIFDFVDYIIAYELSKGQHLQDHPLLANSWEASNFRLSSRKFAYTDNRYMTSQTTSPTTPYVSTWKSVRSTRRSGPPTGRDLSSSTVALRLVGCASIPASNRSKAYRIRRKEQSRYNLRLVHVLQGLAQPHRTTKLSFHLRGAHSASIHRRQSLRARSTSSSSQLSFHPSLVARSPYSQPILGPHR